MKNQKVSLSWIVWSIGMACVFWSCQSPQSNPANGGTHHEQLYGHLYNSNGTPAVGARVSVIPVNSTSATAKLSAQIITTTVTATADGITDKNGRYSFSYVPAGIYNIFGQGGGNVSLLDSVIISSDTVPMEVPNDTLFPPGGITGIVRCDPPIDSRKILICNWDGTILGWPYDSAGHFIIDSMAAGNRLLRIHSVEQGYTEYQESQSIVPGKLTDMGTITLNMWNTGPIGTLRENYIAMKFGVLVSFNMSTFSRCCCPACVSVGGEWGLANDNIGQFRPTSLNCGQWADAAKAAGAKYMILTAKCNDGFCLWPSKSTHYCVTNAACTTDVIRQFIDSTRVRGIQVGLYYSMWDNTNGDSMNFIKAQLTELLSNYGPITCLYFDGWGWMAGYKVVPFAKIDSLVKSLQPNCLVIDNNHSYALQNSEIIEFEMTIDGFPQEGSSMPGEACAPIRTDGCWFWHPNSECNFLPPQMISDDITLCNSRTANFLLGVNPDTSGRLPQCQVDCLKSVGTLRGIQ